MLLLALFAAAEIAPSASTMLNLSSLVGGQERKSPNGSIHHQHIIGFKRYNKPHILGTKTSTVTSRTRLIFVSPKFIIFC
jgi:hypothetical protein